jgi:hypothetical protein
MLSQYMHKFMGRRAELVVVALKEEVLVHLPQLQCHLEQSGRYMLEDKAPTQSVDRRVVVDSTEVVQATKERVVAVQAILEHVEIRDVDN